MEVNAMAYSVGEVARLAHVSVRTLHHYDEVGLLEPSGRSDAGYRLYSEDDLAVLQQVLFYKELGFGLEEIRALMADPAFERREALISQRELVAEQLLRLQDLMGLIDRTLISMEGGIRMTEEEMFEVFGDFDPAEHEEEVEQSWGDTDAYKISARRTASYTKEDWARFKAEQDSLNDRMIAVFDAGAEPTDPQAMDIAEEARAQIDTWFYPLSREMHVCLGEMYVADPRFKANYDKQREGLAQWLCDAIKANAART
jgi:DNA-binding transcriptional MerR regulator